MVREWRGTRIDIAILDGTKAVAAIEVTSMYAFDAYGRGAQDKHYQKVRDDLRKARSRLAAIPRAVPEAAVFGLLVVVHVEGDPSSLPVDFLKYRGVRRVLNEKSGAVLMKVSTGLREALPAAGPIESGSIPGGQCYGLAVTILSWLVSDRA